MPLISNLGHVGIICDDFLKMRDFYTRVLGLTVTDEDPERGSCFLSADPDNEHHELALGSANESRHRTRDVGQVSFIVSSMDALRELNRRFKEEGTPILRTVTHGISHSIYYEDPEGNVGEVYYKTGYVVKQGFSRAIDLDAQSDDEIFAFSQSFEATEGPFQGAKLPVASDD